MTDINSRLLKLIEKNLSIDEICNELNISVKELKRRIESIKYDGYNIDKRYSYKGDYNYYINKKPESGNKKVFNIDDVENIFRIIAVSDTHLCHTKSDIEYIYQIYEYAIKNNINIIIHCGDLLEGVFQSEYDHEGQIKYFLENYPYAPNVLNFIAFGNHEEEFVTDCGFNLKKVFDKEREDIISLGFGQSKLNIKDNNIFVSHKKILNQEYGIKLAGHSHRFRFYSDNLGPIIIVPTLSNYLHTTDYPGALDIEIKIDSNDNFDKLSLKHLTINNGNVRETSYIEYPLKRNNGIKRVR